MPSSLPPAAGQPALPRQLTKAAKQRLDFFYDLQPHFKRDMWLLTIFLVACPFYVAHVTDVGLAIFFVPVELLFALPLAYFFYRRTRRLYDTFQNGRVILIQLESLQHTHTPFRGRHRKFNPNQWTIVIRRPEGPLRIDTHERNIMLAFDVPEQPALVYDKYPNTLIPGYIFTTSYRDFEGEAELAAMPRLHL